MTILTAFEIATHYPDDILITAIQHENTKWVSLMYMKQNGNIHKLMLSFDITDNWEGFNSKEEALKEMEKIAQEAINYIKDSKLLN